MLEGAARLDKDTIVGWAWNKNSPDDIVSVDIFENATLLATVKADIPRKDLAEAGKGNGQHGFRFQVPAALRDSRPHAIQAKFSGTTQKIGRAPISVTLNPQ